MDTVEDRRGGPAGEHPRVLARLRRALVGVGVAVLILAASVVGLHDWADAQTVSAASVSSAHR